MSKNEKSKVPKIGGIIKKEDKDQRRKSTKASVLQAQQRREQPATIAQAYQKSQREKAMAAQARRKRANKNIIAPAPEVIVPPVVIPPPAVVVPAPVVQAWQPTNNDLAFRKDMQDLQQEIKRMATKPAIQMTLEWLTGTIKFLYQQLSRLGSSQQADRMLSLSPRLIDESINFNNQLMAGIRQGIKFMESLVQQNQPLQIVPKPQEQRLILQNPKLLQSLQTESQVNIFISENADIAAIADAVRLQLFRQPVTTYEALTIQASRKYVNRMSDGALTQAQGQIMYKIFVRGTTKTRVWLQNPEPTHRGNRVKYYMTTFTPAVAVSIRDPITNQNRKILRDFEPAIPTNSRQAQRLLADNFDIQEQQYRDNSKELLQNVPVRRVNQIFIDQFEAYADMMTPFDIQYTEKLDMLRLRCFQHLTNHALKHRDWLLRILQNALIRQRITFDQMHMWYAVNTAQVDEIIRNDFNPATFPVHFYDEDNEELQMRQNFQTRQVSAKYIYHLISLIARRSTGDLVETNASVFFFKQGVSPLHLFLLSLVVNAGMAQFAAAAQVLSSEDPGDITAFEFEYMKENLMLPTSIAIFQTAIMGPAKALRAYEFVSTKFEDLQFGNTYLALLKHLVTVMDLQTAITLGPGVNYGLRSIRHEDPKVVGSVRGLPLHSRLLQDGQKLSLAGRQTLWNLAQLGQKSRHSRNIIITDVHTADLISTVSLGAITYYMAQELVDSWHAAANMIANGSQVFRANLQGYMLVLNFTVQQLRMDVMGGYIDAVDLNDAVKTRVVSIPIHFAYNRALGRMAQYGWYDPPRFLGRPGIPQGFQIPTEQQQASDRLGELMDRLIQDFQAVATQEYMTSEGQNAQYVQDLDWTQGTTKIPVYTCIAFPMLQNEYFDDMSLGQFTVLISRDIRIKWMAILPTEGHLELLTYVRMKLQMPDVQCVVLMALWYQILRMASSRGLSICSELKFFRALINVEMVNIQKWLTVPEDLTTLGDLTKFILACEQVPEQGNKMNPLKHTLVLFIVDYAQVIVLGDQHRGATSIRAALMSDTKVLAYFAIKIATGLEQAHIFPTTRLNIISYIKIVGLNQIKKRRMNNFQNNQASYIMQHAQSISYKNKIAQSQKAVAKQSVNILHNVGQLPNNVLALDLQTYSGTGVLMIPYMCCVYGMVMGEQIRKTFTSPDVRQDVGDFLYQLSRRGQKAQEMQTLYIFAHNGAKFDWVILLPTLLQVFPDLCLSGSATDIKRLAIPQAAIQLLDFNLLVGGQLADIAKTFKVPEQKMSDVDVTNIPTLPNTATLEKIQEYCMQDCKTLLSCVLAYTAELLEIYQNIGETQEVSRGLIFACTSSSLAEKLFKNLFLQQPLFGNVSTEIDAIQKSAYYGGMVQVFDYAQQKNIKYIDVNSLYPSAMTQLRVSQHPAKKITPMDVSINCAAPGNRQLILKWSLYKVERFAMHEDTYGMLAVRSPQGGLTYPRCCNQPTWRTGVELQALINNDMMQLCHVSATISYGMADNTQRGDFFSKYINFFYQKKAQPGISPVRKTLYKSLLNQLYGKMGQRQFDTRVIVASKTFQNQPGMPSRLMRRDLNSAMLQHIVSQTPEDAPDARSVFYDRYMRNKNIDAFTKQAMEARYVPKLARVSNLQLSNSSGEPFFEFIYEPNQNDLNYIGGMKRVALFTTALARVTMIECLAQLRNVQLHRQVYYMDTDSFFMSQFAFTYLQQFCGIIDNKRLGYFKDQMSEGQIITRAQFLAPQVYFYHTSKDKFCGKFKGVQASVVQNLGEKLFEDLLKPEVCTISQSMWPRRFGCVKVINTTQRVCVKTRRYTNTDGSTKYYETCHACQEHLKNHRLNFGAQSGFSYIKAE